MKKRIDILKQVWYNLFIVKKAKEKNMKQKYTKVKKVLKRY